jgi:hypothetical protein
VPQQKLNLLQVATGPLAQFRAGPSQVMRRQLLNAGTPRVLKNDLPDGRCAERISPDRSILSHRTKDLFLSDTPCCGPQIETLLYPSRHRNQAHPLPFAHQMRNYPTILAQLDRLDIEEQKTVSREIGCDNRHYRNLQLSHKAHV